MHTLSIVLQVLLGLAFLASGFTKFNTEKMVTEFKRYGLPGWFRVLTGVIEVGSAIILLVGIWNPLLAVIGSFLIACTMIGAFLTHLKVKDPAGKWAATIVLLILALIVLFLNVSSI